MIRPEEEAGVRAGRARSAVHPGMSSFWSHAPSLATAVDLEGLAAEVMEEVIVVIPGVAGAEPEVSVEFSTRTMCRPALKSRPALLTLLSVRISAALAATVALTTPGTQEDRAAPW